MAEEHETLKEKNARLEARIEELEAKLEGEGPLVTTDVSEMARAIPDRAAREVSRITRALLLASVERLKVSAEVIDKFAKEASDLRTTPSESTASVLASVPRSIISGVVKAVDHALDGPSRGIHKFYKSYTAPQPESAAEKTTI